MLRSGRLVVTDVLGQPIGPIFKGPIVRPETSVANHHSTLRNIPAERRSYNVLFDQYSLVRNSEVVFIHSGAVLWTRVNARMQ
jgi:hypothetical protein